jgi:hypothetical protein
MQWAAARKRSAAELMLHSAELRPCTALHSASAFQFGADFVTSRYTGTPFTRGE